MTQVKYLDYQGLSLYDELIKKHVENQDITTQIENIQIGGGDTLIINPGSYNPSTGVATKTGIKVNIDGNTLIMKNVAGTYTAEEAAAYNAANPEATPVAEGDPKPAEYKIAVADAALIQYVSGNGVNVGAVNNGEKVLSAAIKSGDKILSLADNNGGIQATLTLHKYTAAEVAALNDTTVKEAYEVRGINGEVIGDVIKVYKEANGFDNIAFVDEDDQSNKGQFLKFTYTDASGVQQDVYLDVSTLLIEAEAGDGLEVNTDKDSDGYKKLYVKVATASENYTDAVLYTAEDEEVIAGTKQVGDIKTPAVKFLTVTSSGVAINHIKDAINAAIDAIGSDTVDSGKLITGISIDSTNGIVITNEAYIPTVNTAVANKVNTTTPAEGSSEASFSTISIEHSTTNEDKYTFSHNITTVAPGSARAEELYTAEDDEVIAGTKEVGDVKVAKVNGLATALEVKQFVENQVAEGTSFLTNNEISGLFTGVLSSSEIAAIVANHPRA